VKVHINTRDFLCGTCGKSYRTKSGLRVHQEIHGTKFDQGMSKFFKKFSKYF
jgi:hypothetical protein